MAFSPDDIPENTCVFYNTDEIIQRVLNWHYSLTSSCDVCTDKNGPSMFVMPDHPITKGYQDIKRRGIHIRFIAEITEENVPYYKELMKVVELRHLYDVVGNFGIGVSRQCENA